jgi:hypothetical protein
VAASERTGAKERAAAKDVVAASARAAASERVAASERAAAKDGMAAAPVTGLPVQSEPDEQDENEGSDSEAEPTNQRPVDAVANCKTAALTTADVTSSDGGGKERAESYVTKIKIYPVTSAFRPPTRLRSDSRTVSVISITSGGGRGGGFRRRPSRTSNRERPSIRPSRRRYVVLVRTILKLKYVCCFATFFAVFLQKREARNSVWI